MQLQSFNFMYLILNFINFLLFLYGYLPFSTNVINYNVTNMKKVSSKQSNFNKVVIIVIDSLRTDFVNLGYFPKTVNLLNEEGCLMKVKVASPTVTLPRIKALTTGNIPQFTEVFYNVLNPQILHDSILHRAKLKGKKVIFYGDDTWLKVFPNVFDRAEGTSSFFVTDFYEVDDNVTRNVDLELKRNDWDIMILHYLGLDHIGHVYGPTSHLISPKLHEMDDIVSKIYNSLKNTSQDNLILVTGDHGMKDGGGHGGGTYSETHVPLVILGTSCGEDFINQVDIVPNLALLLNLDIPQSSIGQLKRSFLKRMTFSEYLSSLEENANLLGAKSSLCDDNFKVAKYLQDKFTKTDNITIRQEAIKLYEKCLNSISNNLINETDPEYSSDIVLSVLFSILIFLVNLVVHEKDARFFVYVCCLRVICYFLPYNLSLIVTIILILLCVIKYASVYISYFYIKNNEDYFLIVFLILQPISWLSSSFIEEEHEVWYYLFKSYFVLKASRYLFLKNTKSALFYLLNCMLLRFAQIINQTGDKWASVPDFSDFLLRNENQIYHDVFVIFSFVSLAHLIYQRKQSFSLFFIEFFVLFLIFLFKVKIFTNVFLVYFVYVLIFLHLLFGKNIVNFWLLLITLLHQSYNMFLIALFLFVTNLILKDRTKINDSILTSIVVTSTMFFLSGNGNSVSSVDVTVGYLGLQVYNPAVVGVQILISIYSYSVLSHLLFLENCKYDKMHYFNIMYLHRSYSMTVACVIAVLFKNHIFVWTVYTPKLIIEFCHTVVLYSIISVYCLSNNCKFVHVINKILY